MTWPWDMIQRLHPHFQSQHVVTVYRYASRVEEKMASSQLTFEHGWLRLELINMEADMSFSSEYWTY